MFVLSFLELSNKTFSISNLKSAKNQGASSSFCSLDRAFPISSLCLSTLFQFLLSTNHSLLCPSQKKPTSLLSWNLWYSVTLSVSLLKCSLWAFFLDLEEATHAIIQCDILSSSCLLLYSLLESSFSEILYSKTLAPCLYHDKWVSTLDCFTRSSTVFIGTYIACSASGCADFVVHETALPYSLYEVRKSRIRVQSWSIFMSPLMRWRRSHKEDTCGDHVRGQQGWVSWLQK